MLSVGSVFHYPRRDLLVERVVLNALTHQSKPDWHFGEVDPPASEEATAATRVLPRLPPETMNKKIRRHDEDCTIDAM
jgi:hypothetical protein